MLNLLLGLLANLFLSFSIGPVSGQVAMRYEIWVTPKGQTEAKKYSQSYSLQIAQAVVKALGKSGAKVELKGPFVEASIKFDPTKNDKPTASVNGSVQVGLPGGPGATISGSAGTGQKPTFGVTPGTGPSPGGTSTPASTSTSSPKPTAPTTPTSTTPVATTPKPTAPVATTPKPPVPVTTPPVPADPGKPMQGIDVSNWQGTVNWAKAKAAGTSFAIVKATEGTGFVDKQFAANWAGAKKAGVIRGAYHYARPELDAKAQAKHFVDTVKPEAGDLFLVLDLEATKGKSKADVLKWTSEFVAEIKAKTGHVPFLYTYPSFWRDTLGNPKDTFGCPLWIAHYGAKTPSIPGGWTDYAIWQYSDKGKVAGVSGNVDQNKSANGLAAYRYGK